MSKEDIRERGFQIVIETQYGTRRLKAVVVERQSGKDFPVTPSSFYDDKLFWEGLTLGGYVGTYQGKCEFHLHAPCFQEVHNLEADKARAMARTLDKITARIQADGARTEGELFLAMARSLKLSFVVERSKRDEREWRWTDIPNGKNTFVERIRETVEAESIAQGIKAA